METTTAGRTGPLNRQRPAARARRSHRDGMLRRWLAAGDAVAVLLALVVALTLPGDSPGAGTRTLWGLAAIPLMIVLFKLYGLYDRDVKRISHSTVDDLPWLLHATVVGTLRCGCTRSTRRCTGCTSTRCWPSAQRDRARDDGAVHGA